MSPRGRRAELHFHALPGVDDGPLTVEESLALVEAAVEDGTGAIVATPHVRDVHVPELPGRVAELQEALRREGVDVTLHTGGELAQDDVGRLSQDELATIAVGPPTRGWVLLETPLLGPADALPAAADELRARGFGVVLAHPERSLELAEEVVHAELEKGAGLQLNAPSLLGRHGLEIQGRARRLVGDGGLVAIASDAHSAARPPSLTAAADAVLAVGGPDLARRLVDENPRRLLKEGLPLSRAG